MNSLRYDEIACKISKIVGESSVPPMNRAINVQNRKDNSLTEDDGLFIGYGAVKNSFPYKQQNVYGELEETKTRVAILENDYLRATFLLDYGGRLWELIHKQSDQNLLYTNDVIRMRNLAIRNAWFSGGVEWNIGSIGHSPFTSQAIYAAELTDDQGNKILRLYEFERLRRVVFQIDFWLDRDRLLGRVRIDNKNDVTIPMYWWSNIAVPDTEAGRIIAPAESAYKTDGASGITKVTIPYDQGADVTFHDNIINAADYFYNIADEHRKYIVKTDKHGSGLLHCSSRALKGRKLFSWGHLQGSENWQDFLTEAAGPYVEIQAGYAKTQYECVPMPPNTVWEWIECYTKFEADPKKIMGKYDAAIAYTDALVENIFRENDLDKLVQTSKSAAKSRAKLICKGSGFGYIENLIANKKTAEHLEFIEDPYLNDWKLLITEGNLPEIENNETPRAFMFGEDYKNLLIESSQNSGKNNWYVWYHLGVMQHNDDQLELAARSLARSIEINSNQWNNNALSCVKHSQNDPYAYKYAQRAIEISADDYSLVESSLKLLLDCAQYELILELKEIIPECVVNNRIRMYFAFAYVNTGLIDEAENILYKDGGLVIADMREGELSIGELWRLIHTAKNPATKIEFDDMPKIFDFRMYRPKNCANSLNDCVNTR